jgi:hypothetical protein
MQLPESTVKISASSAHRLDRHRQFCGLCHGSSFSNLKGIYSPLRILEPVGRPEAEVIVVVFELH